MNRARFIFCILSAAFVFGVAAAFFGISRGGITLFVLHPLNQTFARHSNPIEGWKPASHNPDPTIDKDYHDYINKQLSREEKNSVSLYSPSFFEDGTGKHAIVIEIGLNGTWWNRVLIYDQHDNRIKVVKYVSGYYMS